MLHTFIVGLRFDAYVIAPVFGVAALLFMLPIKSKHWKELLGAVMYLDFVLLALVLSVDIIYYEHSSRHLADELFLLSNDMNLVAGFIKEYAILILIFTATATAVGVVFFKTLKHLNDIEFSNHLYICK
ncbi:hypothetical protein RsTz2092_03860 [Deferribacterales bacterium RsTz2092]